MALPTKAQVTALRDRLDARALNDIGLLRAALVADQDPDTTAIATRLELSERLTALIARMV